MPQDSLPLHTMCNAEAIRIWREHAEKHRALPGMHLMPLLRGEFKLRPDLLFVGMNPSMTVEGVGDAAGDDSGRSHPTPDDLRWNPTLDDHALDRSIAKLVEEEQSASERYGRYYKPLREFAENAGANTKEYLDMFLMRHTRQADVLDGHWKKGVFAQPAYELFDLFKRTLVALGPKVVLIANAGASNIAIKLLPLTTTDGLTYSWEALPGVPIFLSGMLSGQRALDTFSRERLAAHIRLAIANTRLKAGP